MFESGSSAKTCDSNSASRRTMRLVHAPSLSPLIQLAFWNIARLERIAFCIVRDMYISSRRHSHAVASPRPSELGKSNILSSMRVTPSKWNLSSSSAADVRKVLRRCLIAAYRPSLHSVGVLQLQLEQNRQRDPARRSQVSEAASTSFDTRVRPDLDPSGVC